jgi:DNA-directed RNA polymerase specialized sigma24 family protein
MVLVADGQARAFETVFDRHGRAALSLAYFAGFTHTDIAASLSVLVGTVKGRKRLGLARLRIAFGDPPDALA